MPKFLIAIASIFMTSQIAFAVSGGAGLASGPVAVGGAGTVGAPAPTPLVVGEAPTPTPTPIPRPSIGSRFSGEIVPNLEPGRFMTAGSIGVSADSNSGWRLRLNPQIEYFLTGDWSVGARINASIENGYNVGGFGPSGSYHFWKQDRLDAYVGADILVYQSSQLSSSHRRVYSKSWTSVDGSAGLSYFVTPSVAFGPELTVGHSFGLSPGAVIDTQSLLAHFAIFL